MKTLVGEGMKSENLGGPAEVRLRVCGQILDAPTKILNTTHTHTSHNTHPHLTQDKKKSSIDQKKKKRCKKLKKIENK